MLTAIQYDQIELTEFQEPKSWRLTSKTAGEENTEEGLFRLQGILCAYDLPPIRVR